MGNREDLLAGPSAACSTRATRAPRPATSRRRPASEAEAVRIGAFYQVLLAGLAAVWTVDPDSVPSSAELLAAMRTIAT